MKTIGLNLISIPKQKAGVGFLAVNLLKVMIPKNPDTKFILYCTHDVVFDDLMFPNCVHKAIAPVSHFKKIFLEQTFFSSILKFDDINILLNVHYTAVLIASKKIKQVTIVPDLTYYRYFFYRPLFKSLYHIIMTPFSLLKSTNIVAISHFTKTEYLRFFPFVKSQKISVMYLGPGNDEVFGQTTNEMLLNRLNLVSKQYLLFVGTIEPIKNLYRNIVAFKKVVEKYPDFKFVIVGKRGWADNRNKYFRKIMEYASKNRLTKNLVFTGYLETNDVQNLYGESLALVFTSLYEGFGIPLIEAMASGVPILTSNTSSMPEVAGDAALQVNPNSIEQVYLGMMELINNTDLRKNLIEAGKKRITQFTWENSCIQIQKLFLNRE